MLERKSYEKNLKELSILNIKLIKKLQSIGVEKLILTSLGNSIAAGYSQNNLIRPLLERNETIEKTANKYGIELNRYCMARAQNNNDKKIFSWVLNNTTFKEMHDINLRDYNDFSKSYMYNNGDIIMDAVTNEGIADVIKKSNPSVANIIIYYGGTGSLIANMKNEIYSISSIKEDYENMNSLLTYIQNQNRINGTNTQVYLGGTPDILGLKLNSIINFEIKRKSCNFANTSYIKPVKCDFIYDNGIDFHYDENEYINLNKNIIKTINENYICNMAFIDIDRELYKISEMIELKTSLNTDAEYLTIKLDEKLEYWFNYLRENKCEINHFKNRLLNYFYQNYPNDFSYIEKEKTITKIKRS